MVLRHDLLTSCHDTNAGGGHLGVDKVLAALRQRYFWPRIHQTVKDHTLSCDRCQRIKVDTKRKQIGHLLLYQLLDHLRGIWTL